MQAQALKISGVPLRGDRSCTINVPYLVPCLFLGQASCNPLHQRDGSLIGLEVEEAGIQVQVRGTLPMCTASLVPGCRILSSKTHLEGLRLSSRYLLSLVHF